MLAAGAFTTQNYAQVTGGGTMVVGMGGDATLYVAAGQTTVQVNLELRTGGTVGGAGTPSVTRSLNRAWIRLPS